MDSVFEKLGKEEQLYKKLYHRLPQVWREPVNDWEEMVQKFHRAGIMDIPKSAPSMMGEVLTEEDFFGKPERESVAFNHMRYCPPFLHRIEFIKLLYVRNGQVTLFLNDDRYLLKSGNFCIITSGIRHTVFSCQDEDVVINLLMRESSFSEAFAGILMEQNILSDFFWKILYTRHSNRILLFRCKNDPKLDFWIERIRAECSFSDGASNLLLRSYAMIFLGIVMRDHLEQLQVIENYEEKVYVMPAILHAIRDNLKYITIEELCVRFGKKKEELMGYIIRESGFSYSDLLRDLRLRRAVWLLRNTDYSIEKIVEEVGYSNRTNFDRNFKARFGKTPAEFRKYGEEVII